MEGLNDVRAWFSLEDLKSSAAADASSVTATEAEASLDSVGMYNKVSLWPTPYRFLMRKSCSDEFVTAIQEFHSALQTERGVQVELCPLVDSAWNSALRNVPGLEAGERARVLVVTVGFKRPRNQDGVVAPLLVLSDLRYRGNVGTILRSMVQADIFEGVAIVGSNRSQGSKGQTVVSSSTDDAAGPLAATFAKNKSQGILDKDIVYYSLGNAPLTKIWQFQTGADMHQFIGNSKKNGGHRSYIGVDLIDDDSCRTLDLFSQEALSLLKRDDIVVVVGAEDTGINNDILSQCDYVVSIPCFSASINVSCAFTSVLTMMQFARTTC